MTVRLVHGFQMAAFPSHYKLNTKGELEEKVIITSTAPMIQVAIAGPARGDKSHNMTIELIRSPSPGQPVGD